MKNLFAAIVSHIALSALLASPLMAGAQAPTAGETWVKIQHRYLPSPPPDTVDTLKGGDPSTPVTGIATTFLDTMDMLREAVKRGDNLIITHEPTFYNHRDETAAFKDDPVYKAKLAYIEAHHLVVYRLHDAIHADPSGDHILQGVYEAFGWEKLSRESGEAGQYFVTIPPTTLGELAKSLEVRLHDQTMRVEGNPNLKITHVALIPGAAGLREQVEALNQPVEVLIAGEASEWGDGRICPRRRGAGASERDDPARARGIGGAGDGTVRERAARTISGNEGGPHRRGAGAVESGASAGGEMKISRCRGWSFRRRGSPVRWEVRARVLGSRRSGDCSRVFAAC